jgi:hypothetical protein
MMLYRKKPVTIEAAQFTGTNGDELADWIGGDADWNPRSGELFITTLEGSMHASVNDYIIKGIAGEFYPCKPDIFHSSFDPVNVGSPAYERSNN